MLADADLLEFRIGAGGLLRRAEQRCHLTTARQQIVAALLVSWVPVVALGLVLEYTSGREVPLVRSAVMHIRLLVAGPILLVLDELFPSVCRWALGQLADQEFIPAKSQARFEVALRSAIRISDATLPELLLAVISLGLGGAALLGVTSIAGIDPGDGLVLAEIWYALVALPLFDFLLLRALWRWVIWVRLLVGLSRIDVEIDPTHPDGFGGLGFLRWPSLTYCAMLLFAIASVLCAEWDARFTLGTTISSFVPPLLLFALLGMLIAFGPLLLFVLKLERARRDGLVVVGAHATLADRWFRRRRAASRDAESTLVNAEVQSLAALSATYQNVLRSQFVLIGRRDLIVVLLATLLPMVPLMIASVPKNEWIAMAGLFTGNLPVRRQ